MAPPYSVESASFTANRNNKAASIAPRIVPAVPLPRPLAAQSSRPLTPEHSNEKTEDSVDKANEQVRVAVELGTPEPRDVLTPDSTPSVADVLESSQPHPLACPENPGPANALENVPETDDITIGNNPKSKQHSVPENDTKPKPSSYNFPRELPPPFYPSENVSTPASSASSSGAQNGVQHNLVIMHHPRPSATSIVFGNFPESPNTSPAPPSGGAMSFPPSQPPPGFVPSTYSIPPFVHTNHSHHVSDSNGPLLYSPVNVSYPSPTSHRREQSHAPLSASSQPFYPSDMSFQYRLQPPDLFTQRQDLGSANGIINSPQSPPQSSSKREFELTHAAADFGRRNHPIPGILPVSVSGPEDDLHALGRHLASQFGRDDFADLVLNVSETSNPDAKMRLPVHGIIVGRNRVLYERIVRNASGGTIKIALDGKFVDIFLFAEAVKHLYGAPLLTYHYFLHGLSPFDPNTPAGSNINTKAAIHMRHALAYVTSGHFLEIPVVADRGVDIARDILRWDNIEVALSFALDQEVKNDSQTSNGNGISKRSAGVDNSQSSQATLNALKQKVLGDIIDFLASQIVKEFDLNQSAPQLAQNPRLPSPVDSRSLRHSNRLSQIRFGELPMGNPTSPTFVNTLISSILLSLPFRTLRSLFEYRVLGQRLGWPRVMDLLDSVINERESRRKRLLNVKLGQQKSASAGDERLWYNVYWEEILKPSEHTGSGFALTREKYEDIKTK